MYKKKEKPFIKCFALKKLKGGLHIINVTYTVRNILYVISAWSLQTGYVEVNVTADLYYSFENLELFWRMV